MMSEQNELSELIARAKFLARSDEYGSSAIQTNERIVELAPRNLDARNRLARCHLKAGRLDTASEMYQAVLEFAPTDRIARSGLREIEEMRCASGNGRKGSGCDPTLMDEAGQGHSQSPQLRRALDGLATDPSDMVEALLHIEQRLRSRDREWIRDMYQTASQFYAFTGYTPRQSEVIVDIYRKYFPRDGR
jgi:tetratricopeptide (TPR) repeat protein